MTVPVEVNGAPDPVPSRSRGGGNARPIVDCDVHNALTSTQQLKPYLPRRWHQQCDQLGGRSLGGLLVGARPSASIFRDDAWPTDGKPGSSLPLLQEQLLDRWNVSHAVLSPLDSLNWPTYGEFGEALLSASNEWVSHEWLAEDSRLYGSIQVSLDEPAFAAEQIRKTATNPRFVQIILMAGTRDPLGHPRYWPIYEAAAECDLPIAVHVGGFGGGVTGAGVPQFAVERHASWPQFYIAHVTSLLYHRVFVRFPGLKFILQEAGLGWMTSTMWRLDRSWKKAPDGGAGSDLLPSEIIRQHIWFTTQPLDEPELPKYFEQMLDHLGMNDKIMFSTDYPHWDFDAPDRAIPRSVKADVRDMIFARNAEQLFRFPG